MRDIFPLSSPHLSHCPDGEERDSSPTMAGVSAGVSDSIKTFVINNESVDRHIQAEK